MPWRRMGKGGIAPTFLTSVLDRDEWSVSRRGRFTPEKWAPGTHFIRDWPVWTLLSKEISCPFQKSNPGRPTHSPLLYRLSYLVSCVQQKKTKEENNLRFSPVWLADWKLPGHHLPYTQHLLGSSHCTWRTGFSTSHCGAAYQKIELAEATKQCTRLSGKRSSSINESSARDRIPQDCK
jgi:hypothetical protein